MTEAPWWWPHFAYAVGLLWDTFWAGAACTALIMLGGMAPTPMQLAAAFLGGAANYVRTTRRLPATAADANRSP